MHAQCDSAVGSNGTHARAWLRSTASMQGGCGSCWANAAVSAIEAKLLIEGFNQSSVPGGVLSLSRQQIVSADCELPWDIGSHQFLMIWALATCRFRVISLTIVTAARVVGRTR